MLNVYIDFKCPGSYLALAPTLAFAKRCGVAIGWRACRMPLRDLPREGAELAAIESHQRARIRSQQAIHRKYAALRGIYLRFPQDNIQTDYALGVLCNLVADTLPFIQGAFAAYWEDHRDLDAPEVVGDLLRDSGVTYRVDETHTRAALTTAQQFAEDRGVVATPAYELNNEIFVGRQHLPWIEDALG